MIEVNDYVRTKNGYIIKVDENTNIFNLGYKEQYVDMETTKYGFTCEEELRKLQNLRKRKSQSRNQSLEIY